MRRFWLLRFDSDLFAWRTPWFLIWLSYGGIDHMLNTFWWGVRFEWRRREPRVEGALLFTRRREIVFRQVTRMQFVERGGLPL